MRRLFYIEIDLGYLGLEAEVSVEIDSNGVGGELVDRTILKIDETANGITRPFPKNMWEEKLIENIKEEALELFEYDRDEAS